MERLEARLQKRMHVSLYALLFLTVLLGISVLLEGCSDTCETKVHYTYYEPVYMSLSQLRGSTELTEPQPVKQIGKIYKKDQWLFLNEPGKGIHIIDNSDPSKPSVRSFLSIPGSYDLAVQGNALYADSYIDLVVFDISQMDAIREVNRVESVFSNNVYPAGFAVDEGRGLITSWEEKKTVEISQSDCSPAGNQPILYLSEGIAVRDAATFWSNTSLATTPGNGSGPGVGGSMARFTIAQNHLYALENGSVLPFDISTAASPQPLEKTSIAWDIETIFPYQSHLFIGSSSGMHILDISNAAKPVKVSSYEHMRSCDPVVVEGNLAYVTLRSGTECQGFTNQLEVIDISNIQEPQLLKTYPMHNPHGLGIDAGTLFICDGDQGLKVFDAEDTENITSNLLAHYDDINAYDVIPFKDVLVMIGKDGLFQYDYSDPANIKLLSRLPVNEGN